MTKRCLHFLIFILCYPAKQKLINFLWLIGKNLPIKGIRKTMPASGKPSRRNASGLLVAMAFSPLALRWLEWCLRIDKVEFNGKAIVTKEVFSFLMRSSFCSSLIHSKGRPRFILSWPSNKIWVNCLIWKRQLHF